MNNNKERIQIAAETPLIIIPPSIVWHGASTNRAILAVYLFYEERFLIALTPKWLLKNWCSSWSIHLEYLSFSSFHLKHHRKICWRIIKVMHSRNWRLFVKVGNSIRDDQHCIDIVWPALYTKYSIHRVAGPFTPTITPSTTPTLFRKVQKMLVGSLTRKHVMS